jgi:hypothetical protein
MVKEQKLSSLGPGNKSLDIEEETIYTSQEERTEKHKKVKF